MVRTFALIGFFLAASAARTEAQEADRRYVVGIRSALAVGTVELSGLDPSFADLAPDGPTGPHISGFFLMYTVRPHLRIGVETLVASSDPRAATTMNYQAAGPVIELTYGRRWFVSGGIHFGGLIVNAMARIGAEPADGASTGTFFKGEGFFVAPQVDVGRRFGRAEVGLFVKQVQLFGEEKRGGLAAFDAPFVGLRVGLGL